LKELVQVQHFASYDRQHLPTSGFDLNLRVDDGTDAALPPGLHPSAFWAIDTHLDFDRCLAQTRACDLTFAAQRNGAEALRRAGIRSAT
jgi:O-antigen biosynthesis protein